MAYLLSSGCERSQSGFKAPRLLLKPVVRFDPSTHQHFIRAGVFTRGLPPGLKDSMSASRQNIRTCVPYRRSRFRTTWPSHRTHIDVVCSAGDHGTKLAGRPVARWRTDKRSVISVGAQCCRTFSYTLSCVSVRSTLALSRCVDSVHICRAERANHQWLAAMLAGLFDRQISWPE